MSIFDRHADTRTTEQKLEAMAAPGSGASEGERENAKHLLFKRRSKATAAPKPNDDPEGTRDMSHADFMTWLRRKQQKDNVTMSDLGMRRGKNASGTRTTYHGPPPPGFHDIGAADD